MARAFQIAGAIDPRICRVTAEERFSATRMAADYLGVYERLARPAVGTDSPRIEEVRSLAGLERVRSEWLDLWRRVPGASIFQHPDWLIPWCAPFGVNEPWLLAVRRGNHLIGVAPLLVYERERQRVLTLMGAGISDVQDVLVEPSAARAVLDAVWYHLEQHQDRFDVVEFENLPPGSPLLVAPPSWIGTAP